MARSIGFWLNMTIGALTAYHCYEEMVVKKKPFDRVLTDDWNAIKKTFGAKEASPIKTDNIPPKTT